MTPADGGSPAPEVPRALDRLSRGVLAFGMSLCLAVLAIALSRLHPEIAPDQLLLFYVLPLVGAGLFAFGLRLDGWTRVQLSMLLVSTGAALVAAEAALAVAEARSPNPRATPEAPSVLEIVTALRASGDHAFPTVPGNVLVDTDASFQVAGRTVHPVTSVPGHSSVVLCSEVAPVRYVSDRYGFNNPDSAWDADIDVALVGDSYTHGWCVDEPDQVTSHVRTLRPALNLGVTGAGPLQELAVVREYASRATPRHVVWIYYEGNDLYDLGRESARPWLTDYLDADHRQGLADRQAAVDAAYGSWVDSLYEARFTERGFTGGDDGRARVLPLLLSVPRFSHLRRLSRIATPLPVREPFIDPLPGILTRARDDVASWGGTLHLAYLPAFDRYATLGTGRWGPEKEAVVAAAQESGIPVVDLDSVFVDEGEPKSMWTGPRGHLNPRGYRVVASAILEALGPTSR